MTAEEVAQEGGEAKQHRISWLFVGVTGTDGSILNLAPEGLPSVLSPFHKVEPNADGTFPPLTSFMDRSVMLDRRATTSDAPLPAWITSDAVVDARNEVESAVLLMIWEAVMTSVVQQEVAVVCGSNQQAAQQHRLGVVLGLRNASQFVLLSSRLRSLLIQGRIWHALVLVPQLKNLGDLAPLVQWEREVNMAVNTADISPTVMREKCTVVKAVTIAKPSPKTSLPMITPSPTGTPAIPSPSMDKPALLSSDEISKIVALIAASVSRVSLVSGPTGCGKSTLVPNAVVNASPQHVVWIAQPRRVAAVSLANRMQKERGSPLEVGYRIGGGGSGGSDVGHSSTRMMFMTAGIMLQRVKASFRSGTFLRDTPVTHIVLDEVHERTIEYDLLLCLLRELLRHHPTVRLVLTSATMSTRGLQTYMYEGLIMNSNQSWHPTRPGTVSGGGWDDGNGTSQTYRQAAKDAMEELLSQMGCRSQDGTEPHADDGVSGRPSLDAAVPVFHIPSVVRPRRIAYLEDAYAYVTRQLPAAAAAGGASTTNNNDDDVSVSSVSPSIFLADATGEGRTDTTSPLKSTARILSLPFSLRDIVEKPQHRDSLLWEARFKLLSYLIRQIHADTPLSEAILVFLPGISHLEALEQEMSNCGRLDDVVVLLVHSSNDMDNHRICEPVPSNKRKILIATNIAESSLTIPDVDHVIDSCIVKDQRFLFDEGLSTLEERYCSKDSCEQRAGRTGRLRMGTVWRLVPKSDYDEFDESRVPSIVQSPLTTTILLAVDSGVGDMERFVSALPTPPPLRAVVCAIRELTDSYQALSAIEQPRSHWTLQPTLRGIVLSALGLPVAVGELVLLGVMIGITPVALQAAAILAASATPLSEQGASELALFDHGTGCDVVAYVEVFRWWCRRTDSPYEAAEDAAVYPTITALRPHVCAEIHQKVNEMAKTLSQFGLASPHLWLRSNHSSPTSYPLGRNTDWLTADELMHLIVVLSIAFVHRTTLANDLTPRRRRHESVTKPLFAAPVEHPPSNRVRLVLRTCSTAGDAEAVAAFLKPATCTVHRTGDNILLVDVTVEKPRDEFGFLRTSSSLSPHPPSVRLIRNMTYDVYRLIKANRQVRRELNIAFADSQDDTHLLSSWFVQVRPAIFIDRGSVLYPLIHDPSMTLPPAVVGCQAVRRGQKVALQSTVLLPGGFSMLPLALAATRHWNGREEDDRGCLVLPALPHCHPSPKYFRRYASGLLDDIATLRLAFADSLNEVMAFLQTQSFLETTELIRVSASSEVENSLKELLAAQHLAPAWMRLQQRVQSVQAPLQRILLLYMKDLPSYFCPQHIHSYIVSHASALPMHLQSESHITAALAFKRTCNESDTVTPYLASKDLAAIGNNSVFTAKIASGGLHYPSLEASERGTAQQLMLPQQRMLVGVRELRGYRAYVKTVNSSADLTQLMTIFGVNLSEIHEVKHGGAITTHHHADYSWVHRLKFAKSCATSMLMDDTCSRVSRVVIDTLTRCCTTSTASSSLPVVDAWVDMFSDLTCGQGILLTVTSVFHSFPVRHVIATCDVEWQRHVLESTMTTALRHGFPAASQKIRWTVTGASSTLSTRLAKYSSDVAQTHRENDCVFVVGSVFLPPPAPTSSSTNCSPATPVLSEADENRLNTAAVAIVQHAQAVQARPIMVLVTPAGGVSTVAESLASMLLKRGLRLVPVGSSNIGFDALWRSDVLVDVMSIGPVR